MSKDVLRPVEVITSGNMAGNLTSSVLGIAYEDNVGAQVVWTGTPTGTIDFQVSLDHAQDPVGNVTNAGTWITLGASYQIALSGSAGSKYVNLPDIAAPYFRIVYTASSGSGTLNAWLCAKSK